MNRRQFLRYTAGSGLVLGLGGITLPATAAGRTLRSRSALYRAGSGQPLRIPPTFSGDSIIAARSEQSILPGQTTQLYTYGGSFPAPTIRVRSGDTFSVSLHNQLDEQTNIHWHGLVIPPAMDGHPKDAAMPGGTFDYSFTVEQRAATCWYHPHPHEATGKQVYLGMAGLFIIEDDEELALGLPSGDHEVPLVIQDRRISPTGELSYVLDDSSHQDGFLGDIALVNGTADPYLEVEAGLYRFRILNGSNARIYDLAFVDGRTFHVIGTDDGLLDRPYPVTYAYLAPGERLDVLVDFSQDTVGSSALLHSIAYGGSGSGEPEQGTEMPIIRFDVVRTGSGGATIPTTLATLDRLDPDQAARTRTFFLRMDHDAMPNGHTINDKVFDMMRIDEEVPIGDTEIWIFRNISLVPHPMHLHGAQFQVLDRNGSTSLAPTDFGWKDTVFVRPFQEVRVIVRFGRWPGTLLVHCHNLEHEDSGMMLNFAMVEAQTGVEERGVGIPSTMDLR